MKRTLAAGLAGLALLAGPAAAQMNFTAPSIRAVSVGCKAAGGQLQTVSVAMNPSPTAPGLRYLFMFQKSGGSTTKVAAPYGQSPYAFALQTGGLFPSPGWAQATKSGIVVPAGLIVISPKGNACAKTDTGPGATPP